MEWPNIPIELHTKSVISLKNPSTICCLISYNFLSLKLFWGSHSHSYTIYILLNNDVVKCEIEKKLGGGINTFIKPPVIILYVRFCPLNSSGN